MKAKDHDIDGVLDKHPGEATRKDDLDSMKIAVSIGADYQGLIEFAGGTSAGM